MRQRREGKRGNEHTEGEADGGGGNGEAGPPSSSGHP